MTDENKDIELSLEEALELLGDTEPALLIAPPEVIRFSESTGNSPAVETDSLGQRTDVPAAS